MEATKTLRTEPPKNLIAIQDEFVSTVNAGHARWSHRKGFEWQKDRIGGHYARIYRGAQNRAHKDLAKWGFTVEQRAEIIRQAHEVAVLERNAE